MTQISAADLTFGFSSLVARAGNIRVPAAAADAQVVIITQRPSGSSDTPHVPDAIAGTARVVALDTLGVAKSRNAALREANTRFLLFCDDDVTIELDGVLAAAEHLAATGGALALGRAVDETGELRKNYPDGITPLKLTNSAKAATYEMLVDAEKVRGAGISFDERFGAGAPNYLGDEYIFIADLLRAGLKADSVPFVVAMHPTESSGSRWSVEGDLDARGKALERAWNSRATIAKAAFAWRNRARFESWGARFGFIRKRHFDGT